jgi:hypothetical protein
MVHDQATNNKLTIIPFRILRSRHCCIHRSTSTTVNNLPRGRGDLIKCLRLFTFDFSLFLRILFYRNATCRVRCARIHIPYTPMQKKKRKKNSNSRWPISVSRDNSTVYELDSSWRKVLEMSRHSNYSSTLSTRTWNVTARLQKNPAGFEILRSQVHATSDSLTGRVWDQHLTDIQND